MFMLAPFCPNWQQNRRLRPSVLHGDAAVQHDEQAVNPLDWISKSSHAEFAVLVLLRRT
jgi:hypothetical protein